MRGRLTVTVLDAPAAVRTAGLLGTIQAPPAPALQQALAEPVPR